MLEGARNLVAGRGYFVVDEASQVEPDGKHYLRLQKAIDRVVTQTIMTDPTQPGWRVMMVERHRPPRVVWPAASGDDGDGDESLVPRRPRPPAGSGAIALPLPEDPHTAG